MSRALVIGAETQGLAGVDNDARDVAAWLTGCGFVVDLRVGHMATRDAMLDGLRALIADARVDDAVVVYYSGHGGVLEVTDAPPSRLGYLVPTDHEPGGRFRGITEPEWSTLIVALTARTRNVAVIHDCCHAAQTVRSAQLPRGRVRALAPLRVAASDIRAFLGAPGGAVVYPLGNPEAVRLTATSGRGLAWECASAGGRVQGVFTRSLLLEAGVLRERAVSWAELGGRVRERVLRASGRQRPEIEGPTMRRVFGIDALDAPTRISVRPEGRRFVLAAGRVHGVEHGDLFRSASSVRQTAVVTQVGLFESIVRIQMEPGAARAFEAVVAVRTTTYPCAIDSDDEHADSALATAIKRLPRLCLGSATNAIARVRIERGRIVLLDERGPMGPSLVADAGGISRAVVQLSRLAAIRTLQRTAEELDDPAQLAMTVERVGPAPSWLANGADITPADRVCVHLTNNTQHTLWSHVFAAGPGSALDALGPVSSGTQIEPRSTEILGAVPGLGSVGFALRWPAKVLPDGARPIELIAIATTVPVDLAGVINQDLGDGIAPMPEAYAAVGAMPSPEASRDIHSAPTGHRATATRWHLLLRP